MKRREFFRLSAALAGLGAAGALRAQQDVAREQRAQEQAAGWPSRPVRVVLPFAPGGGTDFQGRILCDYLTRALGQQFYIDFRPGAGSNIGVAEVARSAPDGYTLGWITVASRAINPRLCAKPLFDHIRDLAPVSMVGTFPNLLVVNNALPAGGGVRAVPMSPREFTAFIREDTERWAPAIRASGARVE